MVFCDITSHEELNMTHLSAQWVDPTQLKINHTIQLKRQIGKLLLHQSIMLQIACFFLAKHLPSLNSIFLCGHLMHFTAISVALHTYMTGEVNDYLFPKSNFFYSISIQFNSIQFNIVISDCQCYTDVHINIKTIQLTRKL